MNSIIEYENYFQIEGAISMSKRESYNTKQKDVIFEIIKKQTHEFTIKDIYNSIKDQTGLTTIYRLVDKLVEEGKVRKYINKNSLTCYEYLKECNEENHFYLKCDNCGNMIHIDCDCIEELSSHILKKHQFRPNRENIIINGLCNCCAVMNEEKIRRNI